MLPSGVSSDIKDLAELTKALKHAITRINEGDNNGAYAALRYARGIVNVSDFLEPHAKAIMTSVFAEFSSVLEPFSSDADVLFDNFLRSMEFIYGSGHVVMSDCYTMVSSYYTSSNRLSLAIDFAGRALANRISSIGLMHASTADSHYNLGLIYRLNGQLVQSKRELRICRGIHSSLSGEESIRVARVDISLGQTERLLIAYDRAYLHFFLAFRSRAIILGPCHAETSRAYQLLHSIRYAYSDRLITSVELLDRIDELGWFQVLDNAPSEGGDEDVFVVVSSLLTRVYAARSGTSHIQANGSVSKFSYKTGLDSSGGSAGTLFGDCLVFRESKLRRMVEMCVSERVHSLLEKHALMEQRSFDNLTDLTDDGSPTASPRGSPTHAQPPIVASSRLLYLSFHSKENVIPLTNAILSILFPPMDKKTSKESSRQSGTVPLLLTSGQIDFYQQQMNKRIQVLGARAYVQQQLQGDATEVASSPVLQPSRHGDSEERKKHESEDYRNERSVEELFKPPPDPPPSAEPSTLFSPPPMPHTELTPTATKNKETEQTPSKHRSDGKDSKNKQKTSSKGDKVSTTPMRTPVKPKAISVKPLILPVPVVVNRNKSFDDYGESESVNPAKNVGRKMTTSDPSKPTAKEMPSIGGRNILIARDAAGKRVTLRPTTAVDIVDALRIKIFAAGIFPYLLSTDVNQVELDAMLAEAAKKYQSPHSVTKRQSVAPVIQKKEDKSEAEQEAKKRAEAAEEERKRKAMEEEKKKKSEQDSKVKEDEKKAANRKPIPRPPPLPTCWPPVVVDGKNVCGDEAVGVNMADVMGGGRGGGGRGGLLGALLGGRGGGRGGGPLAFLRRKSGGNFKPAGPKLKQLHWETLASTEGTLWEDSSDAAAGVVTDEAFADLAEVFAPAQKKSEGDKKESKALVGVGSKSKQVAVLDGQKSQNMNIMLAKFGSRCKISDIIQAIVSLDLASFTLPSVMTMLDFTPAAFAETGEVAAIKAVVDAQGTENLGKAEKYLHELAKIPRVENYLKSLALILSVDDVASQTKSAVATVIRAADEVRGSSRLKVIFQAILKIGNILNQGSKKSGATGFKISSLPKLTQTKSNSGETVLDYLIVRLGRDSPDVLDVKADMPSLEEAKYVNFPTLQLDISKLEAGMNILLKLKEDIKKALDVGPNPIIGATPETFSKICQHEGEIATVLQELKDMMTRAQETHAELCAFLGEDPKTSDPEKLYGELFSFVNSVESVIVRKLKRL